MTTESCNAVGRDAPKERIAAHTPGPWKARIGNDPQWWVCGPTGDFHVIATTSQGNDEANARLIAAAPELLEALLRITDQLERIGDSRKDAPFIEEARAAIAKARGQA